MSDLESQAHLLGRVLGWQVRKQSDLDATAGCEVGAALRDVERSPSSVVGSNIGQPGSTTLGATWSLRKPSQSAVRAESATGDGREVSSSRRRLLWLDQGAS
jgi:hypothetical protein